MTSQHTVPPGAFTGINSVQPAGGTRVFDRPMHVLEILLELSHEKSRKQTFAAVLRKGVVEVISAPQTWADGKIVEIGGAKVPATVPMPQPRVGDEFTDYMDLSKDYSLPSLKLAMGRIFGVDPNTIQDPHVAMAFGPGQPCFGIVMESRKVERPNKINTVVYTRTDYVRRVPVAELADRLTPEGEAYLARLFKVTKAEEAIAKMLESEAQLVAALGAK